MEMPGAVSPSYHILSFPTDTWTDFSHDMSRKRAYRWGEDGIAGVSDTHGRMHIAFSFWNEKEWVTRPVRLKKKLCMLTPHQ